MYVHAHVYVYVNANAYASAYVNVYVYVHMYVYVYVYVYVSVGMYGSTLLHCIDMPIWDTRMWQNIVSCRHIHKCVCTCIHPIVHLSTYVSIQVPIHVSSIPSISLSSFQCIYPSICCLFIDLGVHESIHRSVRTQNSKK